MKALLVSLFLVLSTIMHAQYVYDEMGEPINGMEFVLDDILGIPMGGVDPDLKKCLGLLSSAIVDHCPNCDLTMHQGEYHKYPYYPYWRSITVNCPTEQDLYKILKFYYTPKTLPKYEQSIFDFMVDNPHMQIIQVRRYGYIYKVTIIDEFPYSVTLEIL